MVTINQEDAKAIQEAALMEAQLKKLAARHLTTDAMKRLSTLRATRPELALQAEVYIAQLEQAGQIKAPIDEEQLKQILNLFVQKRRTNIVRK